MSLVSTPQMYNTWMPCLKAVVVWRALTSPISTPPMSFPWAIMLEYSPTAVLGGRFNIVATIGMVACLWIAVVWQASTYPASTLRKWLICVRCFVCWCLLLLYGYSCRRGDVHLGETLNECVNVWMSECVDNKTFKQRQNSDNQAITHSIIYTLYYEKPLLN